MAADVPLTRRGILTAAAWAVVEGHALPAWAQAYPAAGPVRVIVPFAAAGPVDILARIIVDALAKELGQSVIVENRGGAGGNIAMGAAARAKPDGYTLLLTSSVRWSTRCCTAACRSILPRISRRFRCLRPRPT
jgi:tripartite-type tricarboxylate transporter receptor subunit TctC